jgi:hypothetical protein
MAIIQRFAADLRNARTTKQDPTNHDSGNFVAMAQQSLKRMLAYSSMDADTAPAVLLCEVIVEQRWLLLLLCALSRAGATCLPLESEREEGRQ